MLKWQWLSKNLSWNEFLTTGIIKQIIDCPVNCFSSSVNDHFDTLKYPLVSTFEIFSSLSKRVANFMPWGTTILCTYKSSYLPSSIHLSGNIPAISFLKSFQWVGIFLSQNWFPLESSNLVYLHLNSGTSALGEHFIHFRVSDFFQNQIRRFINITRCFSVTLINPIGG